MGKRANPLSTRKSKRKRTLAQANKSLMGNRGLESLRSSPAFRSRGKKDVIGAGSLHRGMKSPV